MEKTHVAIQLYSGVVHLASELGSSSPILVFPPCPGTESAQCQARIGDSAEVIPAQPQGRH